MKFDIDDLFRWVDKHEITRQKKNLHRDFSDAVPLAEILKKYYPKLVDLHNYVPRNAVSQKLINWETLNRKVLNKIKINLTFAEQEQLAKAAPGAIEKLLHKIKTKVESQIESFEKRPDPNEKVYFLEGMANDESPEDVLDVKIKTGTRTSSQKLLPVNVYNKMEKELTEKGEEVFKLQQQVGHLENIISIKDERINDLTRQLQEMVNGDGDNNPTSTRSRFFNKIF
ncbi:hypothetical protein ABEB36_005873 [Hypothenemus hampei]|uniref:Calponin-homology (CH) domain-containing protein n=1 Tax=Hypothenemus hampei TaxID=57062 RepID=A0ABD1EZQ2_HYPHA